MKRIKPLNVELQQLKYMEQSFELNLKNRFENLKKDIEANTFCTIMKEEASRLSQRRKDCYKDTEEDILVNQLDEKRKTLRNKTIRTEEEKTRIYRVKKNSEEKEKNKVEKEKERTH